MMPVILSREDGEAVGPLVILSREDGEAVGPLVILSREDGEESQVEYLEILRSAQDDGGYARRGDTR